FSWFAFSWCFGCSFITVLLVGASEESRQKKGPLATPGCRPQREELPSGPRAVNRTEVAQPDSEKSGTKQQVDKPLPWCGLVARKSPVLFAFLGPLLARTGAEIRMRSQFQEFFLCGNRGLLEYGIP